MNYTPGSLALYIGVFIVVAFAAAGLLGWIHPIVGVAVWTVGQMVGTVAFFAAYYVGTREETARSRRPTKRERPDLPPVGQP